MAFFFRRVAFFLRGAFLAALRRAGFLRAVFGSRLRLLWRSERLEESKHAVTLRRILAHEQRDLLPQDGKIERPVGKQQRTDRLGRARPVYIEEKKGKAEAAQGLEPLESQRRTNHAKARLGPLDEEALVLAAHGELGAVSAHRR